jgi:hypothetical protein
MPAYTLDEFRLRSLATSFGVKSFTKTWPYLRAGIVETLGEKPDGEALFKLGDHLSELFLSVPKAVAAEAANLTAADSKLDSDGLFEVEPATSVPIVQGSRSQGDVSAGGVVWECLVTWYLNLVAHGTDLIAARRTKANTPTVITDAICVTLQGHSTTTESDVVVYSVPKIDLELEWPITIAQIDTLIKSDTSKSSVAIVQCKTNWNDNAQIPMLWDLIYRSLPFVQTTTIRLGRNGVTPRSFKGESIKYAFMTVPTNQKSTYKEGGVAVTRVKGLSGGNYWGKPTAEGVASGFSEFLSANFSSHFHGSIQNHMHRELIDHPEVLKRYLDLAFED